MTNDVSIKKLILVPALITLAVTLLRLTGELMHWSKALFNPAAGGGGALVGIAWLVPVFGIYGIAFVALLVPVVIISFRAYTFERSRWSESDHPPMQLTSGSGDDE